MEEYTTVSGEFKVTCSSAISSYHAGYAFLPFLNTWAVGGDNVYSFDAETSYPNIGSVTTSASGNTYSSEWLQIDMGIS